MAYRSPGKSWVLTDSTAASWWFERCTVSRPATVTTDWRAWWCSRPPAVQTTCRQARSAQRAAVAPGPALGAEPSRGVGGRFAARRTRGWQGLGGRGRIAGKSGARQGRSTSPVRPLTTMCGSTWMTVAAGVLSPEPLARPASGTTRVVPLRRQARTTPSDGRASAQCDENGDLEVPLVERDRGSLVLLLCRQALGFGLDGRIPCASARPRPSSRDRADAASSAAKPGCNGAARRAP